MSPDIRPKGKKTSMGGVHNTKVDNDTRSIVSMDIKPKTLSGAGSGKPTSSIKDLMSTANKRIPKK